MSTGLPPLASRRAPVNCLGSSSASAGSTVTCAPSSSARARFSGLEAVAISLVVVAVVLVVALRYGRYVSMVVDSPDREVFLLKVLGAALLVAGFASALQV